MKYANIGLTPNKAVNNISHITTHVTMSTFASTVPLVLRCNYQLFTEPRSGFDIAFNMFDMDGNQKMDKKEFLVVSTRRKAPHGWLNIKSNTRENKLPSNLWKFGGRICLLNEYT